MENKYSNYQKLSFSQSGEDLIVDFIFTAIGVEFPTYIDVGAHHPYYINNTFIFYKRGCRGINIEPDPELYKLFLLERQNDCNLNVGVSDCQDVLDFYIMNVPTLNTFSKIESENHSKEGNYSVVEKKKINVYTLHYILEKYNNGIFPDFLSLDAEGIDEIVLKSIDFVSNKPLVICVETITFSEKGMGIKNYEIINYLESKGYIYYADTHINSIFVLKSKWIRV